jgi:hypothetical protein
MRRACIRRWSASHRVDSGQKLLLDESSSLKAVFCSSEIDDLEISLLTWVSLLTISSIYMSETKAFLTLCRIITFLPWRTASR